MQRVHHRIGHLHLGRSPTEFHFGTHPAATEKFFGQSDRLGRHPLTGQILDGTHRRIFRNNHDPAGRSRGDFAVRQIAERGDVGRIFGDPVASGDAAVEKPLFDITADFLGAQKANNQLGIVDRGPVGTVGPGHSKARLGEKRQGLIHQATGGQTDSKGFFRHKPEG